MVRRRRRSRYTITDYVLAGFGLLLIVFVAGLFWTAKSCEFRISPEYGTKPAEPTRTPTPTPK